MINKKTLTLLMTLMYMVSVSAKISSVELKQIWATESSLMIPESVIYDPVDSVIYVSNIDGDPLLADGAGFISKLNSEGEITQLKWITGLNAPKGMGIFNRNLFVSDLTEIVEINIIENKITNKYPVPEAKLLNDIAIDTLGNIFISETSRGNDSIYRLSGGELDKWHNSEFIQRPNGLLIDGDNLVVGSSGTKNIVQLSIVNNELVRKIKVNSIIDGIVRIDAERLIFSDWYGKIFLLENFTDVSLIKDTIHLKQNAADIFFVEELGLLLIPTFFDNRIIAYEIIEKE